MERSDVCARKYICKTIHIDFLVASVVASALVLLACSVSAQSHFQ